MDALLEVKKQVAPYIDLQLVAFPQDGVLRSPGGVENLKRALDKGVDVVGGIPHFERTMADGALSVKLLCEIAFDRGLLVDMHCDESDDPLSRHIETLAFETQRLGLHVAQVTSQQGMRQCFDAVTSNAARVMHLQGYGLDVGCDASFVLLQTRDPVEAIRLRANRLKVWKKGQVVAETAAVVAKLRMAGRPDTVDFSQP